MFVALYPDRLARLIENARGNYDVLCNCLNTIDDSTYVNALILSSCSEPCDVSLRYAAFQFAVNLRITAEFGISKTNRSIFNTTTIEHQNTVLRNNKLAAFEIEVAIHLIYGVLRLDLR